MMRLARKQWIVLLCVLVMVSLLMSACGKSGSGTKESVDAATPKAGGVLKVAVIGEPPTLDVHMTSAFLTQEIGWHIFEGLFTIDKDYKSVPMLADSYQVLDNGKRYSIKLRQNVLFHNGKELTTEDAVASVDRWGKKSSYGQILFKNIEKIQIVDKYTFDIYLKQTSNVVPTLLAFPNQQAAIYPKEIIEAAGDRDIKEFIGTGPFQFVERLPDRFIKVKKFDKYLARTEAPSGHAGKKTAYVDEIQFIPVPEVSVRMDGVGSGQYHFAEQISSDLYESVKANAGIDPVIVKPWWWPMLVLNKKDSVLADVKVRQALLAALDVKPMLQAAFGSPDFYRIDPSMMFKEQPMWTESGKELYNQANVAKAKQLLQEAGYKGQPIRWITTKEYPYMYKIALVASEQLKTAGFNIDLQVVDWATIVQRRTTPGLWDIFSGATTFTPDPGVLPHLDASWPGWWVNPQKEALLIKLNTELNADKRMQIWQEFQQLIWTDVPFIKIGDYFLLSAKGKQVKGAEGVPFPYFWNVWLNK